MDLALFRVVVDFGLVVLILLVQLIIYPSFTQMSPANLKAWHPVYTKRITFVVLPLMLSQALTVILQVLKAFTYLHLTSLLLVIALWLLTFLQAVPLHTKIDHSNDPLRAANKLVKTNRIRGFLWLILFVFSASEQLSTL